MTSTATANDRARGMRADMLTSMDRVRRAYQLYLRVCDEHRDRVRGSYGYDPGEPLLPEHDKLAEQNADRDPAAIAAVTTIKTHLPLAQMYALGYQVEVDFGWRFASGYATQQ